MDIGVKIIYLMSFGDKTFPLHSMYHELTKSSPVFYYLEKNGFSSKDLELLIKHHEYYRRII